MTQSDSILNNILDIAQSDERIRLVALQGSRVNPNVQPDQYQDYDIVYGVTDLPSFISNPEWLDVFGERVFMQTPEDMELFPPDLGGAYSYLMLFAQGHRIDLTLVPLELLESHLLSDSLVKILLDKDQRMRDVPESSDQSYWISKPTPEEFDDACNEFWWVCTYVAKGIQRGQFLYAVDHFNNIVRPELIRMITWRVGMQHDYQISLGKSHHLLSEYLDGDTWHFLRSTYQSHNLDYVKRALGIAMALYREFSQEVANGLDYHLPDYDENIQRYIKDTYAYID